MSLKKLLTATAAGVLMLAPVVFAEAQVGPYTYFNMYKRRSNNLVNMGAYFNGGFYNYYNTPYGTITGPYGPYLQPPVYLNLPGAPYVGPYAPDGTAQQQQDQQPVDNSQATTAVQPQNVLPRTSDIIEGKKESDTEVLLSWSGDNNTVSKVYFALLDRNRKPLIERTITGPPATVRFVRPAGTYYYRVTVTYLNDSTNTVTSSI